MENSPLRFLDYDASQMLSDQVRISQEEEARRFHSNNFENSHEIDLNQDNHYFISMVFEEIGYLLGGPLPPYSRIEGNSKIKISDFKGVMMYVQTCETAYSFKEADIIIE